MKRRPSWMLQSTSTKKNKISDSCTEEESIAEVQKAHTTSPNSAGVTQKVVLDDDNNTRRCRWQSHSLYSSGSRFSSIDKPVEGISGTFIERNDNQGNHVSLNGKTSIKNASEKRSKAKRTSGSKDMAAETVSKEYHENKSNINFFPVQDCSSSSSRSSSSVSPSPSSLKLSSSHAFSKLPSPSSPSYKSPSFPSRPHYSSSSSSSESSNYVISRIDEIKKTNMMTMEENSEAADRIRETSGEEIDQPSSFEQNNTSKSYSSASSTSSCSSSNSENQSLNGSIESIARGIPAKDIPVLENV